MVNERWQELVGRLTGALLFSLVLFVGNAIAWGQPDLMDLASGKASPLTPAPPPPFTPPRGGHESGIVVEIPLDGPSPEIVTRARNATQVYRISPRTSFWRVDLNSHKGEAINPRSIFPGDLVDIAVEFSAEGKIADGVTVYVREERGVVREFGPAVISFENGRSFQLSPAVRVLISGRLGEREAIQPGSTVIVRINPVTREVTEILLL